MAIPTHLQASHQDAQCRQEAPVSPGLWKLLVAAAAILMLLVGAVRVFHEEEEGLAFQTPFGHTDHPSSL
jgi:hypothetical protein